eukprot:gene30680-40793_t
MRLLPLVAILFCSLGAAPGTSDAELSSLSHQLAQLRATHGENEERNAGPELIPVKRALLTWVERQLPKRPPDSEDGSGNLLTADDLAPLAAQMNAALDTAGLTCGREGTPSDRCKTPADASAEFRGYLEHVTLGLLDGDRYLLVITGVGVSCGFDESAYVFEQRPDHAWHLLSTSERNDYARDRYKPEHLIAVNVAPSQVAWNEAAPPPLIATLGYSPWCSSNWHSLYARLWRASAMTPTPPPVLAHEQFVFMVEDRRRTASSVSGPQHRQRADDKLARIGPVALDPQAFVEEWLTSDWSRARQWNERRSDDAMLARVHPPAPRLRRFAAALNGKSEWDLAAADLVAHLGEHAQQTLDILGVDPREQFRHRRAGLRLLGDADPIHRAEDELRALLRRAQCRLLPALLGAVALLPFFGFNYYFVYELPILNRWMALDFGSNAAMFILSIWGWRMKIREEAKL